jgi:hypothetical protein
MWLCRGQDVPPISVTCSKWVYKKSPFCFWVSAFGLKSAELLPACLINLLPESFGVLLVSVWALLQHFWGTLLGFEGWHFHLLITSSAFPAHQEGCPCQAPLDYVDPRGGALLPVRQGGELQLSKGTWKGSGTKLGVPLIRMVINWVQIQAASGDRRGV